MNNAVGFTNNSSPKPVLHFWTQSTADPTLETGSDGFLQIIRGIDIEVGSGNAGAVGIRMVGAQDTMIADVKITFAAGSGYAGLYNLVGDNSVGSLAEAGIRLIASLLILIGHMWTTES